jgi:flagellar biosynthesis/type III secretory pathway protein FliH
LDPHNNGIGDGDDDDDDDEFFGSQDDCNMAIHELNAKNNEIKNIGFLNAYDEFKESRLQEGFEKGYLESFEIGKMIGKMIGEITTLEKANANEIRLLENVSSTISTTATQQSPNNNLVDVQPRKENSKVTEIVHDFFTNKFQNDKQDPSNVVQDLENLKQELKNLQHMNNGPC